MQLVARTFGDVSHDTIDPFFTGVEGVEAEFVAGDEVDDQTGAYAQGKSRYIDYGVEFIPEDVAPAGLQVMFKHGA